MKEPLFTRRRVMMGAGAAALLGGVDAFAIEPTWLEVNHFDVAVPKLPLSLDGFRIVQITDTHLQALGAVEKGIMKEVRQLDAGLVLLTGDIVNGPGDYPLLQAFCRELAGQKRKVVAILGNWEHWGEIPIERLSRTYADVGVTLLENEATLVDSAIGIVATDDSLTQHANVTKALSQRPNAPVSLFLTHCPELFDRVPASAGRFDLSLAGHTHGGQARLGSLAPFTPPGSGRFVSGWYDVSLGRAYVSRGTGMSVIPGRFGCRPELPVFTLRRG